MDPNVAYRMMIEYFMEDELDDAIHAAKELRNWIEKGGFPPNEVYGFDFRQALTTVLNFEHTR